MLKTGVIALLCGWTFWVGSSTAEAQTDPDFKQVHDLLKAHLPGITEAELNRAAVRGLLAELRPRAMLVDPKVPADTNQPGLGAIFPLDSSFGYLRVERLPSTLPEDLEKAYRALAETNHLRGIVLDLRFAHGDDYSVAAEVMSRFLTREIPLADWGGGLVQSVPTSNPIALPVVGLINDRTAGAPELLAELIRRSRTGILLGRRTAGEAAIHREFPLADGIRLRVATSAIRLADGSSLPTSGVEPDIAVEVRPEEEREFYTDPFKAPEGGPETGTAGPRRGRFNEAELVRERRQGLGTRDEGAVRKVEAEAPVVYDPALARALDVLKGLAVVRPGKS